MQAREERTVAPKTHKIIFSPSIWRGDDRTKAASQTLAFAKRLDQRLRRHWGIVLKRHLELLLHPVVSSFAGARLPFSIPYRRAEKSRIERQASPNTTTCISTNEANADVWMEESFSEAILAHKIVLATAAAAAVSRCKACCEGVEWWMGAYGSYNPSYPLFSFIARQARFVLHSKVSHSISLPNGMP